MKRKSPSRGPVRVIRTPVYTAKHLKRFYPEGFTRALEKHCEHVAQESWTMDEIMDSLKGLYAAAGVKMRDWEIGAYSYSHIRAEFSRDGTEDLDGARALAWIENNLLAPLRAPYGLNKKDGNLHESGDNGKRGRHYRKRWARYYAPGSVKSCPFTGVCWDDDFLDALIKDVKDGETLRRAFEGLADVARELIEGEDEYRSTPEAFLEDAAANEWTFTKEGKMLNGGAR